MVHFSKEKYSAICGTKHQFGHTFVTDNDSLHLIDCPDCRGLMGLPSRGDFTLADGLVTDYRLLMRAHIAGQIMAVMAFGQRWDMGQAAEMSVRAADALLAELDRSTQPKS